MKQLLILSGKGGTGKTTVAGAFVRLSAAKACADCDVDAPNLHLIINRVNNPDITAYYGLPKAVIDETMCSLCGQCRLHCRFGAISPDFKVDPFACEGCAVCSEVCPTKAISMVPAEAGKLMLYSGKEGVFSTAELYMGSGTSGKLVTEVKRRMTDSAPEDADFAVVDGSPGIGCPVIASLSGADMVLIVAEPSVSGISDMERILQTAGFFQVKTAVCVNKADVSPSNTKKIESFCRENGIPLVGKIPYDPAAVETVNRGLTVADVDCPAGLAVKSVFWNTMDLLYS
jgi:MinD superfamily P-loop ATPase